MWFAPGWVPPETAVTGLYDAEHAKTRPETVLHYVVGIYYEHEAGEGCDFCVVPLDRQKTVQYNESRTGADGDEGDQTCDWKPPIVLADGPIGRTPEEALNETADTQ